MRVLENRLFFQRVIDLTFYFFFNLRLATFKIFKTLENLAKLLARIFQFGFGPKNSTLQKRLSLLSCETYALIMELAGRMAGLGKTTTDEPRSDSNNLQVSPFALLFAIRAHHGHTRKVTGDPYICHPIQAVRFLQDETFLDDQDVFTATLLHDTVEDTTVTLEEIESCFGIRVARLVAEVTDDRTLTRSQRKRAQLAHIADCSKGAKLIKAADMWDNLSSLMEDGAPSDWSVERVQGYFVWKYFIFQRGKYGEISGARALPHLFDTKFFRKGRTFFHNDEWHPTLPEGDLEPFLERYLCSV